MGIFDRFRRKEQPPKRRSYAGVNTSRLFADFSTMTRSSDAELKPALRVLQNRFLTAIRKCYRGGVSRKRII